MARLTVWRIPFSTNVQRVAIAAHLKGVDITWVDVDPADRSPIEAVSGQPLAPVARFGDDVVADSPRILARLEAEHPDPPLWPREPAARAAADVFVEWFNEVWKRPPNAIAAARTRGGADPPQDVARLRGWTGRFEDLLAAGPHLLGPELTVADVVAWPFLRYGLAKEAGDEDPFHHVLHDHLAPLPPRARRWADTLQERFADL